MDTQFHTGLQTPIQNLEKTNIPNSTSVELRNNLSSILILFIIWLSTKGSTGTSRKVWAWLITPGHIEAKVIVTDATFSGWLPPCKNSKILIISPRKYRWLKNPAKWLEECISEHNLWSRIFTDNKFLQKITGQLEILYKTNFSQIEWQNSTQKLQSPNLGHFWPFLVAFPKGDFFPKNQVVTHSLCWIPQKINNPLPKKTSPDLEEQKKGRRMPGQIDPNS